MNEAQSLIALKLLERALAELNLYVSIQNFRGTNNPDIKDSMQVMDLIRTFLRSINDET